MSGHDLEHAERRAERRAYLSNAATEETIKSLQQSLARERADNERLRGELERLRREAGMHRRGDLM